MKDVDIADFLNSKELNMTWEEAMNKYNRNYSSFNERTRSCGCII